MTETIQPTEQVCQTTGLCYLTAGRGQPPVVLVHGWSAFKEIWWSSMLAIAPYAQAVALDLPGHGGSARRVAHSMADIAGRVEAFCAARGLADITLVGHSMGGNIAVELALRSPQLVRRLVLVNPAIQGPEMPGFTRSYLLRDHGWPALRASLVLARGVGALGERIPHRHGGGIVRPIMRRMGYMARHDPERLHLLLGSLFQNPLLPRLPSLTQETLVIAGQHDPLVPASLSRRVAQAIPRGRFELLARCAHNPMDERPAAFEAALLTFLGHGAAHGRPHIP